MPLEAALFFLGVGLGFGKRVSALTAHGRVPLLLGFGATEVTLVVDEPARSTPDSAGDGDDDSDLCGDSVRRGDEIEEAHTNSFATARQPSFAFCVSMFHGRVPQRSCCAMAFWKTS